MDKAGLYYVGGNVLVINKLMLMMMVSVNILVNLKYPSKPESQWTPFQYNFSSLYKTEAITAESLDKVCQHQYFQELSKILPLNFNQVYRDMNKEGSQKFNG